MAEPSQTVGAVLLGLFIAIYLTASSFHLTSSYVRRTADPWQWRTAVCFLTAVSTAHTAILCYSLYEYLIVHFGDVPYLSTAEWDLVAHYAIFITTSLLVQLYFALRISTLYTARPRTFFVAGIVVLALAQLGFGIAATYSTARLPVTLFEADLREQLGWQTMAGGIAAVLCDVLIFVATFKDMRTSRFTVRSETIFEVVSRLLIETNFVTTIVAILSLAFYLAWDASGHPSGVSMAFAILTPKLYLLSMLASINRGAEAVRSSAAVGFDSKAVKHASSLSDMFKGTPLSRIGGVTVSRIGAPFSTPIADKYSSSSAGGNGGGEQGSSWLRRTLDRNPSSTSQTLGHAHLPQPSQHHLEPPIAMHERPLTAMSASVYGGATDYYAEYFSSSSAHGEDAKEGGHSTSIEVGEGSGTPTPRKATFDEVDLDRSASRRARLGEHPDFGSTTRTGTPTSNVVLDLRPVGSPGQLGGREPIRYGYL
ncbi:hypothetical protein JCM8547_008666 [Rhodosporidiobolus lusitaniae]